MQWIDKLDHSFRCYFDRQKGFLWLQWIDKLDPPFRCYFDRRLCFLWLPWIDKLTIPSGVTSIGNDAFYGCSGLTSIYVYPENLPELESGIFSGCNAQNCTVYVPKGTYDAYKSSEFGYFEKIVEFDATGIDKVTTSTDAKEVSRYSVNGQRLSAPAKGLNIVKYSDGSVKKVAVQ